jgi:hypothetical protein
MSKTTKPFIVQPPPNTAIDTQKPWLYLSGDWLYAAWQRCEMEIARLGKENRKLKGAITHANKQARLLIEQKGG